jgi:hypothetical protein
MKMSFLVWLSEKYEHFYKLVFTDSYALMSKKRAL